MAMKITINEASPRKFRAKPSDRGVGGKWGPADTYNIARDDREQSVKNWKKDGTFDSEFIGLLESELDKAGTPFKYNTEHADRDTVWLIAQASDFGINDIDWSKLGMDRVDCDRSDLPRNGIARLLSKICNDFLEDDDKGGAGAYVTFNSPDDGTNDTPVRLYITYPLIDDPDLVSPSEFPTRKEIVTDSIDTARKVTAYLKKMAPVINRESSRTFHESKCSMQKRIESFRK